MALAPARRIRNTYCMVLFFTTTLLISIVGLSLLLSLKHWELRTGAVLGRRMRAPVGNFFHTTLLWLERILPTLIRVFLRRAFRATVAFVHRSSAWAVLWTEWTLEHVLHLLRKTTSVRHGVGEASVFLREVAEHKRKLLKENHAARAKVPVRE